MPIREKRNKPDINSFQGLSVLDLNKGQQSQEIRDGLPEVETKKIKYFNDLLSYFYSHKVLRRNWSIYSLHITRNILLILTPPTVEQLSSKNRVHSKQHNSDNKIQLENFFIDLTPGP